MKILNAAGSTITMTMIRLAIVGTGHRPESAVMHPKQVCAVVQLAECIALAEAQSEDEKISIAKKMVEQPMATTIAGIPIVQDPSFPEGSIEFRDEVGAFSRIENLAVPFG